jgi:glyoxylase-like metal-dependent hydrolase (beta-lactamase superfamily II)
MLEVSTHGEITRLWMARSFGGRTLHSVSAYLLGDTLVDSGSPATADELADWCSRRGVRRVVHTHHHEDHTGGDAVLVERLGLEIWAPASTVPILGSFYRLPWYRRLVWGQPRSATARPYGEVVTIGGSSFRAIPTPGHAADHHCLFDPQRRWLFSGDLFISTRVTHVRRSEDAATILSSLRRLQALDPALVICSHAGIVANARGAIERRIAFWEELGGQAASLAANGVALRTIRRRLLGSEGAMMLLSCGDFSKTNLIRSLLGMHEGGAGALV